MMAPTDLSDHIDETKSVDSGDSAEADQLIKDELLVEELLVEDISIDGMCGVY